MKGNLRLTVHWTAHILYASLIFFLNVYQLKLHNFLQLTLWNNDARWNNSQITRDQGSRSAKPKKKCCGKGEGRHRAVLKAWYHENNAARAKISLELCSVRNHPSRLVVAIWLPEFAYHETNRRVRNEKTLDYQFLRKWEIPVCTISATSFSFVFLLIQDVCLWLTTNYKKRSFYNPSITINAQRHSLQRPFQNAILKKQIFL